MRVILASFAMALAAAASAQVPAAELARPPADAKHFTIMSTAGRHGDIAAWTAPDGTLMARMSLLLRGQSWEEDEAVKLGADGAIAEYRLRGTSPNGDVGETFAVADGTATWKSPFDGGTAPYKGPAYYLPAGFSIRGGDVLNERAVAAGGADVALLPGGRARAEKLVTMSVGGGSAGGGSPAMPVTAWAITGVSGTPYAVWTDAKGRMFASIGGLSVIRAGYESAQPALQAAQDQALGKRSPVLARTLAAVPAGAVAFTDVRAFVDGDHFADHRTVVVDKGRIVAVGAAGQVAVPSGAKVFAGAGKTLVPGLWDSHMHVGDDYTGPTLLSLGVTSVRDPGNDVSLTKARAQRRAAGDLLSPHVDRKSVV